MRDRHSAIEAGSPSDSLTRLFNRVCLALCIQRDEKVSENLGLGYLISELGLKTMVVCACLDSQGDGRVGEETSGDKQVRTRSFTENPPKNDTHE